MSELPKEVLAGAADISWIQWVLNVALSLFAWLVVALKRTYDERLKLLERQLYTEKETATATHMAISSQTQLVSERVTKLEGALTATLSSVDNRLTRIEGLLDAMMRAGFGRNNAT